MRTKLKMIFANSAEYFMELIVISTQVGVYRILKLNARPIMFCNTASRNKILKKLGEFSIFFLPSLIFVLIQAYPTHRDRNAQRESSHQ
jgi:hypothetical protein